MSKYEPLWRFLQSDGIEEVIGFEIDHSFLTYKKEAANYGYSVDGISMKNRTVDFRRIAA